MATETAAEVFDRLASQLVSVRKGEIKQKAAELVGRDREAQRILDTNEDPLNGLLLRKEVFWSTQELEGELKKARSFPVELRALLERFGVANIPLETGKTMVEQVVLVPPAAVTVLPPEKKRGSFQMGPSCSCSRRGGVKPKWN